MWLLAWSRVALACAENLSKSGAVMHDRLQGSPAVAAGTPRTPISNAGRGAGWGFLLAGMFGVLVACGSDDSAPQTSTGGSGGGQSVTGADADRALPGEGFEATPDFDITDPQKPVPPRDELVEGIANLNGTGGSSNRGSGTTDAGAGDAGAP
jgi:hypothetical protein